MVTIVDLPPPTGPISSRMRLRTSSRRAAEAKYSDELLERLLDAEDLVLEELVLLAVVRARLDARPP